MIRYNVQEEYDCRGLESRVVGDCGEYFKCVMELRLGRFESYGGEWRGMVRYGEVW